MVRKESTILGIDLHEQEIRVVQVGIRSNKPYIGKIGRAPMPEGAIISGRIQHVGPISVALRLLLNSMGVGQAAHAVCGVLGDSITLRTLSVPPVPDNELAAIIAGEVAHYGLIHTPGGAYSYLKLSPPSRSGSSEPGGGGDKRETFLDPEVGEQNPSVVTVMAVEEDILLALGEALDQANVTTQAMEPAQYGMYRCIMASAGPTPTLFGLMVNPASTDIVFIHKGLIVGYRRIDIGSRVLTLQYSTAADAPGTTAPRPIAYDELKQPRAAAGGELNRLAVHSLSLEVQRTLNYYQREFPDSAVEDNVYIAIDDSRLEDLAKDLTFELGVNVETVQPSLLPIGSQEAAGSANTLAPIYATAFGLAVQGQVMARAPRLDLFSKHRAGVKQAETQRNFLGSIVTSVVAISVGIGFYFVYHRQIVELEKETVATNAKEATIRTEMNTVVEKRHKKEEQYKALRDEGAPVTAIMDFLASNVKSGTGLTSLTITPDFSVLIAAEAVDETHMLVTEQSLQKCPVFTDIRLIDFHQMSDSEGDGVYFNMIGKCVSIARLKLPGDPTRPDRPRVPAKTTAVKGPNTSLPIANGSSAPPPVPNQSGETFNGITNSTPASAPPASGAKK